MIGDHIAAWRRQTLLRRIVAKHDRAHGVQRRPWVLGVLKRTALMVAVLGLGGYAVAGAQQRPTVAQTAPCLIKGNISDRGERIYHVPGGTFYDRTRISSAKGERWFCTEEQARIAGWRRSKR